MILISSQEIADSSDCRLKVQPAARRSMINDFTVLNPTDGDWIRLQWISWPHRMETSIGDLPMDLHVARIGVQALLLFESEGFELVPSSKNRTKIFKLALQSCTTICMHGTDMSYVVAPLHAAKQDLQSELRSGTSFLLPLNVWICRGFI